MNPLLKAQIERKRREYARQCSRRAKPVHDWFWGSQFRDIPYVQDGEPAHTLDIYSPISHEEQVPVIINIHGGSFIMGSKADNRHFCMRLCNHGFLVFSVEYRLCPEATVFDQLQDISAALHYIEKKNPKFRGTSESIHMIGDDAGAFLALYTAAIQHNSKLARAAGIQPSSLNIRSMALISGRFFITRRESGGMFSPRMLCGDDYRQHPFYPYLCPERLGRGLSIPPGILITSSRDSRYHDSWNLYESFPKIHTPFQMRDYGEDPHLYHAFCVAEPELPESRMVIHDIVTFFHET